MACVPSWLPLSSHIVTVTLANAADMFARATPITKPAVSSYGSVTAGGNWLLSGTVPSEGEPVCGVERKIAYPPRDPVLRTSAHPTAVDRSEERRVGKECRSR